ncbi:uncharacterized protein LOC6535619 [Drosophila yakuba]|uniref:Protein TsetseEP domain-containing protein n=1 Tax=Drosophila yakuba TaxID=7245 RepID=B4PM27_DROYA|nr:uncharacterized protein LOC6535619 [Drosophila yakuba]XP_039494183.1 uncharacterized protein LOC120453502 [Drosophila santomea]EDW95959.1 uncharacterized protein Dyak_GE25165 [Drosophila yakuba]
MSGAVLITFCVLVVLTGQSVGQNVAVQQSIDWANEQFKIAQVVAQGKLPNVAEAQNDAKDQLDTLKLALSHCEAELKSTQNVDLHKTCVKAVFAGFYTALDRLAAEHWPIYGATSGASRIGFFC